MDAQYSFNFADLREDYIRQNYVTIPYNIHQNKLFNFSILMNKIWNAVKIAEPSELPLDGTLAEIGLFKLFSPSHDPNGDIKAQIIIYITGIPQKISAADYLDKQIPVIYKDKGLKIIQSKTIDTNFGKSKDVLFHIPVTIHYSCPESVLLKSKTIQKHILLAKKIYCT